MAEFTIDDLRQAWGKSNERRERANIRRLMYDHEWADLLKEAIEKQYLPENAAKILVREDRSINLLRWAVDKIAAIYSRPVLRSIGEFVLPQAAELDLALERASRWTLCLGEALLRPVWVGERMLIDVLPPDLWHAWPDALDRTKLSAVLLSRFDSDGNLQGYEFWTAEEWRLFDKGWNEIDSGYQGRNPYGIIPWIATHASYPVAEFWHDRHSEALAEAALQLAVGLSAWNHLRHLQAHKQLVIRSDASDRAKMARVASDPASAILISGPTANVSVLDLQANLEAHLNALLVKANTVLGLYGIRAELVRASLDAPSGYALKLQLYGLEQAWEEQRRLWTLHEEQLWQTAQVIVPIEGGPSWPDGILTIDWPEIGPARDPKEQREHAISLYTAKLWSRRQALRSLGHSEEDIAQIEAEILEEQVNAGVVPPPNLGGIGV